MRVDGFIGRGRPKKVWRICVKKDMGKMWVNTDMKDNRYGWKNVHTVPTAHNWDKVKLIILILKLA